jgi:hypothetical protein
MHDLKPPLYRTPATCLLQEIAISRAVSADTQLIAVYLGRTSFLPKDALSPLIPAIVSQPDRWLKKKRDSTQISRCAQIDSNRVHFSDC